MALSVKFNENPVWVGSAGGKEYSLHRATLTSTVGWAINGYALFKGNMLDEFYYGSDTTPYQGMWNIFIEHSEASTFPLPPADRNDVENFILRFASLCERGGEPLQESKFQL